MSGSACVSWSWGGQEDCCLYTLPVTVTTCEGFLSYHLQPTQACHVAYCSHLPHNVSQGTCVDDNIVGCFEELQMLSPAQFMKFM